MSSLSAPTPPETSPSTFPKFPKLPDELRQMIWEFALPEARILEIDWSDYMDDWYCPAESAGKPCAHLFICVESRQVYLKKWSPILPHIIPYIPISTPGLKPASNWETIVADLVICIMQRRQKNSEIVSTAYYNPKIDQLYITGPSCGNQHQTFSKLLAMPLLQQIKALACGEDFFRTSPKRQEEVMRLLMQFTHLKAVSIVHGDAQLRLRGSGRLWSRSSGLLLQRGTITLMEPESTDFSHRWSYLGEVAGNLKRYTKKAKEEFGGRVLEVDEKQILRGGVRLTHGY
ncbi:hypothetical protein ACEPPN_010296 [Leptodophora sp. 'Broadleaf-Isolate-01']